MSRLPLLLLLSQLLVLLPLLLLVLLSLVLLPLLLSLFTPLSVKIEEKILLAEGLRLMKKGCSSIFLF